MIKRKLDPPAPAGPPEPAWLPPDAWAEIEITSESAAHPIEAALAAHPGNGWRADSPGPQTVRLWFARPQPVRRIRVAMEEHERARTQEFVLRVAADRNGPWQEIARQQFNFSPGGARREQEDFRVELPTVLVLELRIAPDISGREAWASLQELRVA